MLRRSPPFARPVPPEAPDDALRRLSRVAHPVAVVALLSGCSGCRAPDEEPPPEPWELVDTIPLDPFALVLQSAFSGAVAPTRLLPVPDLPSVAALDPELGSVHVMDARYRHVPSGWCVPLYGWPLPDDGLDRQGSCQGESVWIRRGEIQGPAAILAAAADPARSRLLALDPSGRWLEDPTNLDEGNPVDWLRDVDVGGAPGFADPGAPGAMGVSAGGEITAAFGAAVWTWAAVGEVPTSSAATAPVADVAYVGEDAWLATDAGVEIAGSVVDVGGGAARVVPEGEGAWVTVPAAGEVVHVSAGGEVEARVAVTGLTGPATLDVDGRLWVATEDGVAVVADGAEVARHLVGEPLDVLAQPSGEIVLLREKGAIEVYFDETTFPGRAPLHAAVATFFENPKKRSEAITCEGGEPNFAEYLDSALKNRAWLTDLPAAIDLAVSTQVARQVRTCGVQEAFEPLFTAERTELGVLLHDDPPCEAGDQACVDGYLGDEMNAFSDLEWRPTWTSGASAWDLDGSDWVQGVLATGVPPRHLFFGMAILPEITKDDLRNKEPYPWRGADALTGWTLDPADGNGRLDVYPGDPISGFLLGDCPGLLSEECGRVDAGGGATFTESDTEVLSLLLHRAIARRSADGPDTWYFHLPALELFDYTAGCTVTDRIWSGDGCEAAVLQAWLFDVEARLVRGGVVEWTLPSELPEP